MLCCVQGGPLEPRCSTWQPLDKEQAAAPCILIVFLQSLQDEPEAALFMDWATCAAMLHLGAAHLELAPTATIEHLNPA